MRSIIFLLSLFIILMPDVSYGQDTAAGILQKLREKFETINDLSANLTQSVNGKVNLKGMVYYKKENKLRFEFRNILIVSDGENFWNYNQKDNKVIISGYDSDGNKILALRQIIYEYPEDCELNTFESEGRKVLELVPKEDTFSFNYIRLFIGRDYLITTALMDDPATGKIEIDLSDYQLNKNIPDSFFQFTPPEGSQVIDLR